MEKSVDKSPERSARPPGHGLRNRLSFLSGRGIGAPRGIPFAMPELSYQNKIETARERVRTAVRLFSREPTAANESRVATAMRHWQEIKSHRFSPRDAPDRAPPSRARARRP